MTELEQRAKEFATWSHRHQTRKYTGEPYIVHPAEVADIVRSVPHTEQMLAAAWLHDTVEDCGVEWRSLVIEFGAEVASLVGWLTDFSKPSDGNRAARKAIDREHTRLSSPAAKTVKLADLISNSATITVHDPGFAKTYMREKKLLLEVLREGDESLWERANQIVTAWEIGGLDTVL